MFKRRTPNAPADPPARDPGQEAKAVPDPTDSRPAADSGLGVPPYRPAPAKESPSMIRAPLPPAASGPGNPPRPMPQAPGARREAAERRTLVVGRGISVQGTVQDAERLVVEGTVEASMIHASELAIAPGGMFKGEIEVEDAEVAGTMSGTLTVRGSLVLRASGRLQGTARYRRLQVEDGGVISGQMEMLSDDTAPELPLAVTVA
ncbi:MAG: polymer-forming cytoskeletal protein [Acetobacteraceae bacterium]